MHQIIKLAVSEGQVLLGEESEEAQEAQADDVEKQKLELEAAADEEEEAEIRPKKASQRKSSRKKRGA